jgi:hypothetical protein
MKITRAANHFWIWFQRYSTRYLYLTSARSKKEFVFWFDELQMHAKAYCKLLSVDVYLPKEGKGQLVITANGNRLGFRKAEQLAARAPAIENWKITALRPPRSVDKIMEWIGPKAHIDISKTWFQDAGPGLPEVFPIRVYVEYILPGKGWDVREQVMQVIENLVGEKCATMNIELLEVDSRCNWRKKRMLHPLAELPAFIAQQLQPMAIDGDGKLRSTQEG